MNHTPRVSVVMSVYNGEQHVREAIDSILTQTFSGFEFIIVDDGSTDATWGILSSYDDPRIRLERNEANVGLTRSLNRGLACARGEYIARQDADDVSLPERLERQIEVLDSSQRLGLVSTSYMIIDPAGRILRRMHLPTTDADIKSRILQGNPFCHGAAVFRQACVAEVGTYRAPLGSAEDYDLWLRIAEKFDVANLGELLYCWRLRPESVTLSDLTRQVAFARLAQNLAIERRSTGKQQLSALDGVEPPEPDGWSVAMYHLTFGVLLHAADLIHPASQCFRAAVAHTPDGSPGWANPLATMLIETTALRDETVAHMLDALVEISRDVMPSRIAHRRLAADIHHAGAYYCRSTNDRANMARRLWLAAINRPACLWNRATVLMLLEICFGH